MRNWRSPAVTTLQARELSAHIRAAVFVRDGIFGNLAVV